MKIKQMTESESTEAWEVVSFHITVASFLQMTGNFSKKNSDRANPSKSFIFRQHRMIHYLFYGYILHQFRY